MEIECKINSDALFMTYEMVSSNNYLYVYQSKKKECSTNQKLVKEEIKVFFTRT